MSELDPPRGKWRLPVAILLSFLVIMIWGYLQRPLPQSPSSPSAPAEETPPSPQEPLLSAPKESSPPPNVMPIEAPAKEKEPRKEPFLRGAADRQAPETHVIRSDALQVQIHAAGGVVDKAYLWDAVQEDYSVLLEGGPFDHYRTGEISFYPLSEAGQSTQRAYYVFTEMRAEQAVLHASLKLGEYLIHVQKTYTIQEHQLMLSIVMRAAGKETRLQGAYYVINGGTIQEVTNASRRRDYFNVTRVARFHQGTFEKVLHEGFMSFFVSPKEKEVIAGYQDWLAIDNRFYMRILAAEGPVQEAYFYKPVASQPLGGDMSSHQERIGAYKVAFTLAKDQVHETSFSYYYLPKKRDLLDRYYQERDESFYYLLRQVSLMRILSGWIYYMIQWVYGVVMSYGWAIIIVTIFIKILIAPLTIKSYRSMQKIQRLSPRVNAIRSQFKDNPQKANQEIMLLYRKEKANPLSGCLPMLLPLPIFFALYSLFQNMVELKDQSFGWIADLTQPDVIITLPVTLPFLGQHVHLLPILMVITQFVQSLFFTPSASAAPSQGSGESSAQRAIRQQAFLMKYVMPIVFFFICWSMPSALVLYWTVQNVLSIGQSFIFLRHKEKKTA